MPLINRNTQHIKKTTYKHTNQSSKYYNSKYWLKLRNSYIVSHPLCEECIKKDIITPAEHVHHKKEFLSGTSEEERWSLLLDESNLMSVCAKCHHKLHNSKIKK